MRVGGRRKTPAVDGVLSIRKLLGFPSLCGHLEELAVNSHAGEEEDRAAIFGPLGSFDPIGKVRHEQVRGAARRGSDEKLDAVVGLKLLVGTG